MDNPTGIRASAEGLSAAERTVTSVSGQEQGLHRFEVEPEVRDWLEGLSDSDYKRVDEVAGMLAEKGASLGGPWSEHLDGQVRELRLRLAQVAVRVTGARRASAATYVIT